MLLLPLVFPDCSFHLPQELWLPKGKQGGREPLTSSKARRKVVFRSGKDKDLCGSLRSGVFYPLETPPLGKWQSSKRHGTMVDLHPCQRILKTQAQHWNQSGWRQQKSTWPRTMGGPVWTDAFAKGTSPMLGTFNSSALCAIIHPRGKGTKNDGFELSTGHTLKTIDKCCASCSTGFVNTNSFLLFYICNTCYGKVLVLSSNV